MIIPSLRKRAKPPIERGVEIREFEVLEFRFTPAHVFALLVRGFRAAQIAERWLDLTLIDRTLDFSRCI